MKKLGKYLRDLREENKMGIFPGPSIHIVAEEMGIGDYILGSLERGEYEKMPLPWVMRSVARYYSVSMYTLLEKAGYIDIEEDGSWKDRHYNELKEKFIRALAAYAKDRKEIRRDREQFAKIISLIHNEKELFPKEGIIWNRITEIRKGN